MPTVCIVGPYRFFFFSIDRGEPMHVHIARDKSHAKYWLQPVELASSRNFRGHELNDVAELVEENSELIERKWHEHFGR